MNNLLIWPIGLIGLLIFQIIDTVMIRIYPSYTTTNTGVIFGSIHNWFITLLVVFFGAILINELWRSNVNNLWYRITLVIIVSGAISNVFDRIRFGGVIDYLPFFNISVFNIADLAIVFGAALLLMVDIKNRPNKMGGTKVSD